MVALEIPSGLSRKSYDALKKWVDVMVQLAESSVEEPKRPTGPGQVDDMTVQGTLGTGPKPT
jgi:hypothetical protein